MDLFYFSLSAFFEIFGCYAFWLYFRNGKPLFWIGIGVLSLIVFAYLLTKINVENAGKAYAIYGGIYIFASLLWLQTVEGKAPDLYDILGAAISIFGALIILYYPR